MTIDAHLASPLAERPVSGHDWPGSEAWADAPLTDAELTTLALSADPGAPISDDAIPIGVHLAQCVGAALPQWYMAPAVARGQRGWRTPVVLLIVAAFLLIEGLGLCNTFGQLTIG